MFDLAVLLFWVVEVFWKGSLLAVLDFGRCCWSLVGWRWFALQTLVALKGVDELVSFLFVVGKSEVSEGDVFTSSQGAHGMPTSP